MYKFFKNLDLSLKKIFNFKLINLKKNLQNLLYKITNKDWNNVFKK